MTREMMTPLELWSAEHGKGELTQRMDHTIGIADQEVIYIEQQNSILNEDRYRGKDLISLVLTCGSTHSLLQSPMQPDATDQAELA